MSLFCCILSRSCLHLFHERFRFSTRLDWASRGTQIHKQGHVLHGQSNSHLQIRFRCIIKKHRNSAQLSRRQTRDTTLSLTPLHFRITVLFYFFVIAALLSRSIFDPQPRTKFPHSKKGQTAGRPSLPKRRTGILTADYATVTINHLHRFSVNTHTLFDLLSITFSLWYSSWFQHQPSTELPDQASPGC